MQYCAFFVSYFIRAKHVGLFFISLAAAINGNAQQVAINDSNVLLSVKGNPEQTLRQLNFSALSFSKLPDNRANFGLTRNDYRYILLKLSAAYTMPGQYIYIDNTSLDTVTIYRLYADQTSRMLYQGGSLIPFNPKRNYVWHTAQVEISKNPSWYLIALKASQENINVRYEILGSDDLQKKYQAYERLVFFYAGMVCMITTIIVLAFFLFRNRVFLFYLGYMACLFGWVLSHYGRIFPFVYPNLPAINDIVKPVSSLGACIFLIAILRLVFSEQLQLRRWLQQLLKWMFYSLTGLSFLMLLLIEPGLMQELKFLLHIAWHVGLILAAGVTILTPLYFFRTGPTAKIFSSAMLIICLMGLVQLFGNLGAVHNYFINEHGMAMGSLVEISIMAFGLFYNLLEEKKHRDNRLLILEQEQTETLKKLIAVQDNERKRIAGDLHDYIGPLLAALKINFRRIIQTKEGDLNEVLVTKTESIIDDSITEIRNVAHNLMPKSLSLNGLINTLADYFESIQQLYGKYIVFNHNIRSIINPDVQINIYRIVCELVLNAARHSNASNIRVNITSNERCISITVYDDGTGFQPKLNGKKTLGLQNVESRVLYMKGKFSLKAEQGRGTVANMDIPL